MFSSSGFVKVLTSSVRPPDQKKKNNNNEGKPLGDFEISTTTAKKQTNKKTGVSVITWESISARIKVLCRLQVLQV